MTFKSHSLEHLLELWKAGEAAEFYELDTGNDGEDDVLYAEVPYTELTPDGGMQEVMNDIHHHFDIDVLPDHWQLTKLSVEELKEN